MDLSFNITKLNLCFREGNVTKFYDTIIITTMYLSFISAWLSKYHFTLLFDLTKYKLLTRLVPCESA